MVDLIKHFKYIKSIVIFKIDVIKGGEDEDKDPPFYGHDLKFMYFQIII